MAITNAKAAEPVHVVSACPDVLAPRFWMFELFPDCATPPFHTAQPVCRGACPTPCRAIGERRGERDIYEFTYDEHRRWRSTRHGGEVVASCTWAGDHVDRCTDRGVTWTFVRGPRGEIVETHGEPDGIPERFRWANGDLVEMSEYDLMSRSFYVEYTLEYRDHRLVAQRGHLPPDLTYRYDGPRLVERDEKYVQELMKTTFDYDARGRLQTIASKPTSGYDTFVPYTTRYSYDARDRVTRVERTDGEGEVDTTTFEYCP